MDRRIPEAISWMQTMPGKGCNTILRLYSPLGPFFTKEWRPSEIGTNAKDGGARFFAAQNQAIAPISLVAVSSNPPDPRESASLIA